MDDKLIFPQNTYSRLKTIYIPVFPLIFSWFQRQNITAFTMDLILLGCSIRFSFALIKWISQRAKIMTPLIQPLYPIPFPIIYIISWMFTRFSCSLIVWNPQRAKIMIPNSSPLPHPLSFCLYEWTIQSFSMLAT